mgnify:CR=1 FL=1
MKLKLRYYEDKTQVEVNGKWMSLAKAVLHPSVGKEIYKSRDELKEYARKAKELSQIKMLSFTKKIEESYNVYMSSGHASFYVNDKEVERFSDDYVNLYDVKSPSKATLEELKEEFGLAESEMGKIDWVNGTYLANGKPISKEECDFICSYVNNAEFDTETKKISTAVQPANLLIGDFERRGTWMPVEEYRTANIRKLGPNGYYEPKALNEENMRFVSKRNKNLHVVPTEYHILPEYHHGESYGDFIKVGTQFDVWFGDDFYGRVHCFNCVAYKARSRINPKGEEDPFNVEKLWDDKLFIDSEKTDKDCDPIDLVDLETRIILDNYSKAKTKNDELGS